MTLLLRAPLGRQAERAYAADCVLRGQLGLAYSMTFEPRRDWYLADDGGRELRMPDVFFAQAESRWLRRESVPEQASAQWDAAAELPDARLIEPRLPVIFGEPGSGAWLDASGQTLRLGLDVLGHAFFFLSRYEECSGQAGDARGRADAAGSLALRAEFLERPLLDEYVEILRSCVERLWPGLVAPRRSGRLRVTCDVDEPYERASKNLYWLSRRVVAQVLKRGDFRAAASCVRRYLAARRGDYTHDPNNTFSWMFETCERHGQRLAFYLISGHSAGAIDGCYSLTEPFIRDLLREIHRRGHEIGMHASYNTWRDGARLTQEQQNLRSVCAQLGIAQSAWGNRQHFLRWDPAATPAALERAGFDYDSTLGYADRPGFRCGTAHPFPLWDWTQGRALRLIERPLIFMEGSVFGAHHMNRRHGDETTAYVLKLRERALKLGGDFVMLWHNSHLRSAEDRQLYERLLQPA